MRLLSSLDRAASVDPQDRVDCLVVLRLRDERLSETVLSWATTPSPSPSPTGNLTPSAAWRKTLSRSPVQVCLFMNMTLVDIVSLLFRVMDEVRADLTASCQTSHLAQICEKWPHLVW